MTAALYIIQGIIAGLSGAIAAVISVSLQDKIRRRRDHHIKHKENFEVLKGAIGKVCSDVYLYIIPGNKETPFMGKSYEVNYKSWEVYSIFYYADKTTKNDETYVIRQLDKLLYADIRKHWPEFYIKIDGWNKEIKETGKGSNEIMKAIFEAICKRINGTDVKCRRDPNLRSNPLPEELNNEKCVLATYNFIMDTNPDEWPILYSHIEQLGVIDQLRKIAEDVKGQMEKKLNDFYETVKPFLDVAGELLNELDELIHEEKIKHHCEYI